MAISFNVPPYYGTEEKYISYEQEIFKLYNDKEYYNLQSKKFKSLVDDISDTPKNWNNFNNIISTLA